MKIFVHDFYLYFFSSDSHSVLSILIDSLLSRFSSMLLNGTTAATSATPSSDHTPSSPPTPSKDEEAASLKKFLYREDILLLLATIHHMCTQVNPSGFCERNINSSNIYGISQSSRYHFIVVLFLVYLSVFLKSLHFRQHSVSILCY